MADKKLEGETMSSQRAILLEGNQEESRNNLMKVDDDSPTHMRKTEITMMTKQKEWKI